MDKATRNTLRNAVTQCRRLLEEAVAQVLEGQFGVHASGQVEDVARMGHLAQEDLEHREQILAQLEHVKAGGFKPKEAVAHLVREAAFTHLNRLCAYKMMEVRGFIREAVSRGPGSQGFMFYLADQPEDEALWSGGQQETAYRHYLEWLRGTLSQEIGVLFSPHDPANRLFPPHRVLEKVLELINSPELQGVWGEDETIGWVYQYFTPKELRDQARKESSAPRNSYELAFRNQFYTPRYVVQFLTDNTLGRIWYEMRKGETRLTDRCQYLVRRKRPVFLKPGQSAPEPYEPPRDFKIPEDMGEMWTCPNPEIEDLEDIWKYALTIDGYEYAPKYLNVECEDLAAERAARYEETKRWEGTFEELRCCLFFEQRRWRHFGYDPEGESLATITALHRAVCERWDLETEFIPDRQKKDPRDIKILDPACGSGHFLLYCFDLLDTIYEEAYADPKLGPVLRKDYPTLADLRKAVPVLILSHNLHGIDIDPRAVQIAALALWMRAQRAYREVGLGNDQRPTITRSNVVCAEPMPGEEELLEEFVAGLEPRLLGHLVRAIFDSMKLTGEAGSLLKIEQEITDIVSHIKKLWMARPKSEQLALWPQEKSASVQQLTLFDLLEVTNEEFWNEAQERAVDTLHRYAECAVNGSKFLRKLFMDDVVSGFAFVHVALMKKPFDVVLMNPPFGEASKPSKVYVEKAYPRTKNDVYAAFVERGLELLGPRGMLGAITSRTGFFLISFQKWREEILLREARPIVFADLGYGVLDTAMVETAAYCLEVCQ